MTKKIFAQPEITVVNIKNNDILTESIQTAEITESVFEADAPTRRGFDNWDVY